MIAGEGPLEQALMRMVSALELNDYITFVGRMPHETILELYSSGKIHAVVLPSIETEDGAKEGIPVALMEAMSYAIPVVSTDTGGIPELIGDGSGLMVRGKDPQGIAHSIQKLFEDPNYRRMLGHLGRKKVEQDFNESLISEKLVNLFSNCEQQ